MAFYVVDTIMGGGKTEAAIAYMDEHPERRFLFVTPLLTECDRIIGSCKNHKFYQPTEDDEAVLTKTASLGSLLQKRRDIVMSHALFLRSIFLYGDLVRIGGYTLIQDETLSVISPFDFSGMGANCYDLDWMLQVGMLKTNLYGEIFRDEDKEYNGVALQALLQACDEKRVLGYKGGYYTIFRMDVFRWFRDVYILTYMFCFSLQYCQMKIEGMECKILGAERTAGGYRFTEKDTSPEYATHLIERVEIESSRRLNDIGEGFYDLSSSWYKREVADEEKSRKLVDVERTAYGFLVNEEDRSGVTDIGVHIHSYFDKCRRKDKDAKFLWTTYKRGQKLIYVNGFQKCFLSCAQRASNLYSDRTCLAYCVNVFPQPHIANYFYEHKSPLDRDGYALCEMIQWVWRSAIRTPDGKIKIYIPSKRMRILFTFWLEALQDGQHGECAVYRYRKFLETGKDPGVHIQAPTPRKARPKKFPLQKKTPDDVEAS